MTHPNENLKGPESESSNHPSLLEYRQLSGDLPSAASQKIAAVKAKISDDLNRSRKGFVTAFLLSSLVGYFFSLSLCSQNSVAFTTLSINTAAFLHGLPDPLCPILCGVVFSLLPVLCLFVALDRFQVRRLLCEMFWLPSATTFLACVLMMVLPAAFQHDGMHLTHEGVRHTAGDLVWLVWWTFGALSIPALMGWMGRRRITV